MQCFKSQKVVSKVSAVHFFVLCWFFLHVSFCKVFSLASFLSVEVTIIILLDFLWRGDGPMRMHSDLKTCQLLDFLSVTWNEKNVDRNCICCNSNVVRNLIPASMKWCSHWMGSFLVANKQSNLSAVSSHSYQIENLYVLQKLWSANVFACML